VEVYICIVVGDSIIGRGGWDPIHQFNPATLLCLSQTRSWISNAIIMVWSFCGQWLEVRCGCSFYWWNCW